MYLFTFEIFKFKEILIIKNIERNYSCWLVIQLT